ncbi:MAG: RdgB/HAM1 family non-canonical purine NTP pyrophosphatase [Coriobacteriales bacterium]|jgi:XTP/dITP diphosphohydrolase|nr:RdgB/HAM1 family non-canonical purine NTP pyrophosphatase [Coriobacteriales bacterium]
MPTLVIATHNAHKAAEIAAIIDLPGLELHPLDDFGISESACEDGTSFTANAEIKARFAYQHTGLPALADDSGICVDALAGAPGIYSARYANLDAQGKDDACDASDLANNAKLLRALEGVAPAGRGAHFHAAICFVDAQGRSHFSEADMTGAIATAPRGEDGFGYDPLFLVDAYDRRLSSAELSRSQKNQLSHRGQALRAIRPLLEDALRLGEL